MGYRIVYQQEEGTVTAITYRVRRTVLFCLFFLLFVHLVGANWEEGSYVLHTLFSSSKLEEAAQTSEAMAGKAGEVGFAAALGVFWEQLAEGFGCYGF